MVDHERAASIKEYFHAEWPNRSIFETREGTQEVLQQCSTRIRVTKW